MTLESSQTVPSTAAVRNYMMYGLSLPERALRSTAAMLGGVVSESASWLVPQAFRDSRSYQTFVQQMLDMVANDVGGVKQNEQIENADAESNVESYVAQKTVGSFIDLAGMATLHVSPAFTLAIISDIAYGSTTYLKELSDRLKEDGIIDHESTIDNTADLLAALSKATGETAEAFDTPPISIDGLKKTISETRSHFADVDPTTLMPEAEIDRIWSDMSKIAKEENVGLLELSSAMTMYALNQVETVCQGALTTISVTGELVDRHILDHYWQALGTIEEKGFYTVVACSSEPYLEAVWYNFSSDRPTVTEDLINGKLAGRVWDGLTSWFATEGETPKMQCKDEDPQDNGIEPGQ